MRMACGFVIAKVVAVYTGPSGIAMLGQVQSLFGALNGIVAAPVGTGVIRYTAENHSDGFSACAPWWRASLTWVLTLLVIVIPIACFFAKPLANWAFGDSKYYWLVVTTALALPLSVANNLTASVINGLHQYRRLVGLGMISVLVATVVMVLLVVKAKLDGAMIAAALFMSISGLVMLVGSMRQPWFHLKYWWGKSDKAHISGIGGYVAMAVTSALTVPISLMLVRNILIDNVGWEQAGHWQAVWKISEVYLGVITVALSTYFLPKLASLEGVANILMEIKTTVKIVMPIVMMLALIVYFSRDLAISLLFTEAFRPARNLFAIQLIGDVLKVLSWIYAYPMLSRGATNWFIFTEITFSTSFVLLAYFLVPLYQTQGANIAYTFNYFICFIFVYKNAKRFSR
jgi:O-antigen/teichoic acid export membrane protein